MREPSRTAAPDAPFELERMLEYSRALVAALPEATVLVVDAGETVWVAEGRLLERNGFSAGTLVGCRMQEILPASRSTLLTERYRAALGGEPQSFDYETVDGERLCWIQLTPMYLGAATPRAVISVIQDVTERHRLTAELHSERERRRAAEEMAGLGHLEVDLRTGTVTLSEGARRLLDIASPAGDLTVAEVLERFAAADRPRVTGVVCAAEQDGTVECEADVGTDGTARRRVLIRGSRSVGTGEHELITGTMIDITELRAAERARSESEALFRQGFDRSPIGMALTEPSAGRYLRVNDAFCRLLGRTREDVLGRSFAEITHPDDVAADEDARGAMAAGELAHYEREKRYVQPDGGVVWTSSHMVPVQYANGGARAFFSQVLDITARREREERLIREAADLERLEMIRSALAEDRLVLHAQPIIDVTTGARVQQELLVRLRCPDGGIVPPGDFLPVAERYGSIRQIDQWVTQRAVELAAAGHPVEVNLSAASVGDEEVLATIREALGRTGADPALVVFEVTETALMADIERGRLFATALRDLGCRFALDDFGTGYGTFTYLKHIPIDCLKIDVEFVRDLVRSRDDERVVRAIVAMAQDFGKTTIAEGVEDAATLERLRELGVDHAQGYHLGRPVEIDGPARAAAAPTRMPAAISM